MWYNEEDKTHHINYPANAFSRSPIRNLSQDLHHTRWCPMMQLSFKFRLIYCCLSTACASGRERWRERLWVRAKNEERGEPRLLLEVNNEVSADAVSQSAKTVTDFHLGGISERHLKESRAENADKHKGAYARRPLYFPSPVCASKRRQRCFRHLERSRRKNATC